LIILINGAFGVGKTTVAERLLFALPNSMLYDPEEVGFMVRAITQGVRSGVEDTDDFQDIELWRSLVVITAEQLYKKYRRNLVVPLTLARPAYLRQIKAGLARIGPELHHFCLAASAQTIQQRLEQRGDEPGSWAFQQTARCVNALRSPEFKQHINAEQDPQQIVNLVLKSLNL
jgi:ribose 1,5-bisphosphokinase PhnN